MPGLLLSATFVLITSVVILLFAVRGRLVGDHPHCRRCGFDLTGRPESSTRCSECGADLTVRRAIMRGRRVRNKPLIYGAAVVAIGSFAVAQAAARGFFSESIFRTTAPVSVLVLQARGGSPEDQFLVHRELIARLTNKQATAADVASYVDHILDRQANPATTGWDPKHGDFVEAARPLGGVSDAQWKRYLRQSIALVVAIRPNVRVGDPVPVVLYHAPRAATRTRIRHRFTSAGVMLGAGSASVPLDVRSTFPGYHLDPPATAGMGPGPHTARFTAAIDASDPTDRTTIGVTRDLTAEAPWTLHPADQPTVTADARPELDRTIRDHAHLELLRLRDGRVGVRVSLTRLPVAVSATAALRVAGVTYPLAAGPFNPYVTNDAYIHRFTTATAPPADAMQADLVLTPDPTDAAKTLDVTRYYGLPLTFEGFPVTPLPGRRPATTRAATTTSTNP